MPIYEFACRNCATKVERITTQANDIKELILDCKTCKAKTRYVRKISAPAVVARAPGNIPNLKRRDVVKTKDKDWKKRILEGRRADGSRMVTVDEMRSESAAQWAKNDHVEKKKEIKARSDKGEFKGITIQDVMRGAPKSRIG